MSTPLSIRIFLVDDHAIVRQGVRSFLELQPDMRVVGEAASGQEALRLLPEVVPDVVVMDLLMPGIPGVETIRQIKSISPHSQVLVLTSSYEDEHIFSALRAGALSYLLKDVRFEELAETIRKTARNEAVLHPQIAGRLIREIRESKRNVPDAFAQLTERELDVLRLLSEGYSNAAIAEQLVVSEQTVKGHVSNILGKLHMADRTQAAILAWKKGLMRS